MGRSPVATRGLTVANCGMPTGSDGVGVLVLSGGVPGGAGSGRSRSAFPPAGGVSGWAGVCSWITPPWGTIPWGGSSRGSCGGFGGAGCGTASPVPGCGAGCQEGSGNGVAGRCEVTGGPTEAGGDGGNVPAGGNGWAAGPGQGA